MKTATFLIMKHHRIIGYRGFDISIYLANDGSWYWLHSVLKDHRDYGGWNETEDRAMTDAMWSIDDYLHDFCGEDTLF